jgi:two-component system, OmpR family, sensor histidine kinase VanS
MSKYYIIRGVLTMFKKGSFKLQIFMHTCIIFLLLFFIQIIIQLLFFKGFYTVYKVNQFKDDIIEIRDVLKLTSDVSSSINQFSNNTNTQNITFNRDQLINPNQLITVEVQNETSIVHLYVPPTLKGDIKLNHPIKFQGIKHTIENSYFPTFIAIDHKNLVGDYIEEYNPEFVKLLSSNHIDEFNLRNLYDFNGTITNIIYPTQVMTNEAETHYNELRHMISSYQNEESLKKILHDEQVISHYYTSDNQNLIFITHVSINDEPYSLMSIMSLQLAKEVKSILLIFNLLTSVPLLILALILAYRNARKITKPIKELINQTNDQLFFDKEAEILLDTNEEIQLLTEHFNQLLRLYQLNVKKNDQQQSKLSELLKLEKQNEDIRKNLVNNLGDELIKPFSNLSHLLNTNNYYEAKQEISKLTNLINNLVTVSKINRNPLPESMSIFNLKFLINKVLTDCETLIKRKNSLLQLDMDSVDVIGDRLKIYYVIKSILMTTLNFSDENQLIHIVVKASDHYIKFDIIVPGVTITENTLNLLFEPVNLTHEPGIESNNFISMYLVRLILDQHHQRYGAQNTKDGFNIYFHLSPPTPYNYEK